MSKDATGTIHFCCGCGSARIDHPLLQNTPKPLRGFKPNHSVSYPRCWRATVDFSEHSGTTATSGFCESNAFLSNPIWQFHVTILIDLPDTLSLSGEYEAQLYSVKSRGKKCTTRLV